MKGGNMPESETLKRARQDAKRGKSPSTQAGEFVREEIHHVRDGVHGARSAKGASRRSESAATEDGQRRRSSSGGAGSGESAITKEGFEEALPGHTGRVTTGKREHDFPRETGDAGALNRPAERAASPPRGIHEGGAKQRVCRASE